MPSEDLLKRKINVEKLVQHLALEEGHTLEDNLIQPAMFWDAAVYYAQRYKRKADLKAQLELLRSDLSRKVRKRLAEAGDAGRITQAMVEEQVNRKDIVLKLEENFREADADAELAKLLVEAFRERGKSLKNEGDLTNAEVYVNRRMEGNEDMVGRIKENIKDRLKGKYKKGKA